MQNHLANKLIQSKYVAYLEQKISESTYDLHNEVGSTLSALRLEIHHLAEEFKINIPYEQNINTHSKNNSYTTIARVTPIQGEDSMIRIINLLNIAALACQNIETHLRISPRQTEIGFIQCCSKEIVDTPWKSGVKCEIQCLEFINLLDEQVANILLRSLRAVLRHVSKYSKATVVEVIFRNNDSGATLMVKDNDTRPSNKITDTEGSYEMVTLFELVKLVDGDVILGCSAELGGMDLCIIVPSTRAGGSLT